MDLVIRACDSADARALSLVSQATILETYAHVIPRADLLDFVETEHGVARYADWLARPDHRLWLAEVPGTGAPGGYCLLCPPALPVAAEAGDIELRRIYLLRRFQGGGQGMALLRTAIEAATSAGAMRLLLSVYSDNPGARAFYARQGFAQVGTHRFRVGPLDYDDLVMAKRLDQVAQV